MNLIPYIVEETPHGVLIVGDVDGNVAHGT